MNQNRRKMNQSIMYGIVGMSIVVLLVVLLFLYLLSSKAKGESTDGDNDNGNIEQVLDSLSKQAADSTVRL